MTDLLRRREGEEVTISYGDWPNDVFLLFFGFLPEGNQHDSLLLFLTLHHMVQCYSSLMQQRQWQQQQPQHQQQQQQQQQQRQQQQQQQPNDEQSPLHHPPQQQPYKQSTSKQHDETLALSDAKEQHPDAPLHDQQQMQPLAMKPDPRDAADVHADVIPWHSTQTEAGLGSGWVEGQAAELQARLGPGDWSR